MTLALLSHSYGSKELNVERENGSHKGLQEEVAEAGSQPSQHDTEASGHLPV